ncbi:hypothetical protein EIKCOROL_00625 [Eikenella corrodens ATCC 23834]|uniref:Uncharacterized protein n=1 Tax=Eikenella corrodens ATCC 23834 TaxID=546274 RepID=C0DTE7_EIKCO|nr:hypothetical protein EIKCOROL_00625 [Eikenella corrodens ATCC 23834]
MLFIILYGIKCYKYRKHLSAELVCRPIWAVKLRNAAAAQFWRRLGCLFLLKSRHSESFWIIAVL